MEQLILNSHDMILFSFMLYFHIQSAGEAIDEYLYFKNVEYDIKTPSEELIRLLEDISIIDEEALEVKVFMMFWRSTCLWLPFRISFINALSLFIL
jgi:hypothetical protein